MAGKFYVYKASAGTGKTFNLAKEYLRLAMADGDSKQFAHILAITFTNAAVNEMKERILNYLKGLAEGNPDEAMQAVLKEDLGISDGELKRRAGDVRKAILHNYSDFAVCTIDSFMNRVVKTFAFDLDLPCNFMVEVDSEALKEDVTEKLKSMINQAGEEEATKVLEDYSRSKFEEGERYDLDGLVGLLVEEVLREEAPEKMAKLSWLDGEKCLELEKEYKRRIEEIDTEFQKKGQDGVDEIVKLGLSGMLAGGQNGIEGYFRKLSEGARKANGDMPNVSPTILKFINGDELGSGSAKRNKIVMAEIEHDLRPKLLTIFNEIEELKAEYNSRKMMSGELYKLGLMKRVYELVEAYYAENDLVHNSEMTKRIGEVVKEEGESPYVYERIGSWYNNILIDEFQDTSKMQWQNLVPLVIEGVSRGGDSLVVGDGKQAIYRFRQGDVQQFCDLPKVEGHEGSILESCGEQRPLSTNYRAKKEVVDFNNRLFRFAVDGDYASNSLIQQLYKEPEEDGKYALEEDWKKEGGWVKVVRIQKEGGGRTQWEMKGEMYAALAKEAKRQHEEKGYEYGDILVLARDNNVLKKIAGAMKEEGIATVSEYSEQLSNSHVARVVAEMMALMENRNDGVARVALQVELVRLGRLTIEETSGEKADIANLLDKTMTLEKLKAMDTYDCCEKIINMIYSGEKKIENEWGYAETLLNATAEYVKNHRQNNRDFTKWLKEKIAPTNKKALARPWTEDSEAVRLMTIHKSKGLERKVVMVVPDYEEKANWIWVDLNKEKLGVDTCKVKPTQNTGVTLFDDQIAAERRKQETDKLNLLYVALTRPKEKLIVYTAEIGDAGKMIMRFIDSELPKWTTKEKEPKVIGEVTVSGTEYWIGDDQDCKKKDEPSIAKKELRWTVMTTTQKKIAGDKEKTLTEEQKRGNKIHEILSMIVTVADVDTAIERYCKRNKVADEEKQQLREQIDKIVNGEETKKFFDPQYEVKNECPVNIKNGEKWENKRIDRLVIGKGETWVVDYKTGHRDDKYILQVQTYCAAVKAMGYEGVKGVLLFTDEEGCRVENVC